MTRQYPSKQFGVSGVLFAATAVGAGAFGAHALKAILSPPMLVVYETAVRYQMYHALALFVVAWLSRDTNDRWVTNAGWAFCSGIVLFSGSLYIVTLAGIPWMGAVTPLGGLAFILGWLCVARALWRTRADQ